MPVFSKFLLKLGCSVGAFGAIILFIMYKCDDKERNHHLRYWAWMWIPSSLKNHFFVIHGINTRLGFETTRALVLRDATVILACRDIGEAQKAIESIRKETQNGQMIPMEVDLLSLDHIIGFYSRDPKNLECMMQCINEEFYGHICPDPILHDFGRNQLGNFLMINDLSRSAIEMNLSVVMVSSYLDDGQKAYFEDRNKDVWVPSFMERFNYDYYYRKWRTFYFSKMLMSAGIGMHLLHPGLYHTDFFRNFNPKWYHYVLFAPFIWWFQRSVRQDAHDIIRCATQCFNFSLRDNNKGNPVFITILPSY